MSRLRPGVDWRLLAVVAGITVAGILWWYERPASLAVAAPHKIIGRVARGAPVTTEFTFRTTGMTASRVRVGRTSCGCTAVAAPSAEDPYEGFLQVRVDTVPLPDGPHTLEVTLDAADSAVVPVTVRIDMTVVSDVLVHPMLVDFGDVEPGQPVRANVTAVVSDPSTGIQVTGVRVEGSPAVSAALRGAGGRYDARVELTPTAAPGLLFGTIVLQTTSPVMPAIRIPVRASIHHRRRRTRVNTGRGRPARTEENPSCCG